MEITTRDTGDMRFTSGVSAMLEKGATLTREIEFTVLP